MACQPDKKRTHFLIELPTDLIAQFDKKAAVSHNSEFGYSL
jgi:hypothetical protein